MSIEVKIGGSRQNKAREIRAEREALKKELDRAAKFEEELEYKRALEAERAKNDAALERYKKEQNISTKEALKFWLIAAPVLAIVITVVCLVLVLVIKK
jgi:hypothetical protein